MAIPALSYAIVQGGVDGFIHLASNIQGASNSAASVAAGEVTSGNRSFDNITQDTSSIGNKSGFKTDFNQSYQEGATQVQTADGSILRTFANGQNSMSSGAGVNLSSGSRRFSLSQGEQTAAHENVSNLLSSAQADDQSYNESVLSQRRSAANLVATLAQRESAGETFDYKQLGEKGQNLQEMVNSAKAIHQRDGVDYREAATASIKTYTDAGGKIPDLIPFVKGEAGVRAEIGKENSKTSNQSFDAEENINKTNDTNTSFTNQEAATLNKQWMKDNNIDDSFAEETQASYEKGQMYQQSASQKREEAKTWSQVAEYSKNRAISDDRDMYHDVEQGVMKRYGVSQEVAHQMIESGDKRVDNVWKGISHSHIAHIKQQVQSGKASVENDATQNAILFRNDNYGKVNSNGLDQVKNEANLRGLNKDQMTSKITGINTELEDKHNNIREENDKQYQHVKQENEEKEKVLKERIDNIKKPNIPNSNVNRVQERLPD
jgi:hypothetical protein